jgi:hypothetical protein
MSFRVGEAVEVRSLPEILATLDATGALDGMPFMPEMAAFCGRRLAVLKRADKTCDTISRPSTGLRRMENAVHLEGTRCSGAAHGGCQAGCEIFWKEAWLKPVNKNGKGKAERGQGACTSEALAAATQRTSESGEVLYRCQATELVRATTPLRPWNLGQYVRDIRSGNVRLGALLKSIAWSVVRWSMEHIRGYRLQMRVFNAIQRLRGGAPYRILAGDRKKTPTETLDLAAGEVVEVRSVEEIQATLDPNQKNRGLYFDLEMTPYCGGSYRVRNRVERIINEATGAMMTLPGACVILEGGICTGRYHKACPRAIYSFWREIWLRRPSA